MFRCVNLLVDFVVNCFCSLGVYCRFWVRGVFKLSDEVLL